MSLEAGKLHNLLQQLSAAQHIKTWWLAYSGGVDSQVLLHLLAPSGLDIRAVYIDHGLQPESRQWAEHCRNSCQQLGVPFQAISVDARASAGESPEAAARRARYRALAERLQADHCLLTAQHRDDQAETLLLQLLRGAGAAGLAAMPHYGRFAGGWHMRPLLGFSRREIVEYATRHALSWVEDPSNQSLQYDRNYLRHQVLPLIQQRWPAVQRTLAGTAEQQAENSHLLEQLAELDYQQLADSAPGLPINGLAQLEEARLRNLLRYWIRCQGHPLPSRKVLRQVLQQMFSPRQDATPTVCWAGSELHRYRGRLFLVHASHHDDSQQWPWDGRRPLPLVSLGQNLVLTPTGSEGLRRDLLGQSLRVCFRQGGERLKPAGRDAHHDLKHLFQEAGVPPWMRAKIPLLYRDDELVAVVGYWIADEYACPEGEQGLMPVLSES
jgi:tRNA(Ile)-lysidine synthase